MKTCTLLLLALGATALAEDFAALCTDRAATERVYYNHRLGDKPSFEQVLPPATLERLVRNDLRKEAALKKAYGIEVTPAMLEAEVRRINATTRAPDVLAELKAALGNDPNRFARTVARPIIVERALRDHFDNDAVLHAAQRQEAERVRSRLLAARSDSGGPRKELAAEKPEGNQKSEARNQQSEAVVNDLVALLKAGHSNGVSETMWQLTSRPAETNTPTADELEIKRRFGPSAQILSSPRAGGKEQKLYFEDLPDELQRVLRAQLRQPGDVSAVIELRGGFLVYLCTERTAKTLKVATLSLPKRSCEQWLAEQEGDTR